ncbi:ribosomal protein S20 [Chloropicon primus]|uniref:Ribosomal protein S20 n=1 Tax=Chloropicon primus TaxID=1764295 RepID=A0A5B8MN83_9CHLO|nr:ribosomal protein S20 [Chloropicon primus]UPR00005.1 ribosomal protein S20 [Chloropicon primus]|mmetsp:Transcript_13637/g.38349  ORF Transcript_13637/g.38349 Transcript_13637/m.38349 type:complete len:158 (+) Transcript_13637:115-588(+)|eukprot:QDZ20792.1 ribosomal protein S20 [Chloropicon primus]
MRVVGGTRCAAGCRANARFAGLSSVRCVGGASVRQGASLAGRRSTASVLVVEAKKGDSVKKRQRQNEKQRLYNKGKKSACKTRIKKVFASVEEMSEGALPKSEADLKPIDELISLAYKEIDRAVAKGVMHKNTAARRKARVARARRDLAITAGLYSP